MNELFTLVSWLKSLGESILILGMDNAVEKMSLEETQM